MGVLDGVLAVLAQDAGLEQLIINSIIVRAHRYVAGARKAKDRADAQRLGRSRGDLGNPRATQSVMRSDLPLA